MLCQNRHQSFSVHRAYRVPYFMRGRVRTPPSLFVSERERDAGSLTNGRTDGPTDTAASKWKRTVGAAEWEVGVHTVCECEWEWVGGPGRWPLTHSLPHCHAHAHSHSVSVASRPLPNTPTLSLPLSPALSLSLSLSQPHPHSHSHSHSLNARLPVGKNVHSQWVGGWAGG